MNSWSTSDPSWLLLRALPEWEAAFTDSVGETKRLAYLKQLLEAIDSAMDWAEDAQMGLMEVSEEGKRWLAGLPDHFGELIKRLDQQLWSLSVPSTQLVLEIREALSEAQMALTLEQSQSTHLHLRWLNRLQQRGELLSRTNIHNLLEDNGVIPLAPLRWPSLPVSLDQLTQANSQPVIRKVAKKLTYQAPPKPISEAEIVIGTEEEEEIQ